MKSGNLTPEARSNSHHSKERKGNADSEAVAALLGYRCAVTVGTAGRNR